MLKKYFQIISDLPSRQKTFIGATIIVGLVILFACIFRLFDTQVLTASVFFYSFLVPGWLLSDDYLIDLDNNQIYFIWLAIGIILFIIYLFTRDLPEFEIQRSKVAVGINRHITDNTFSGLKTLLIFLVSYKFLNWIMKVNTGYCLVNTFRQMSWKHHTAKRYMTGLDVVFNIILVIIIVVSVLTR